MTKFNLILVLISFFLNAVAQDKVSEDYWRITDHHSIVWDLTQEERLPHKENIEMSGKNVSAIIYYKIDENKQLSIERDVIFPQLRTYNKTNEPDWKKYRAYFRKKIADDITPRINFKEKIIIPSTIDSIEIGGQITFYYTPIEDLQITKTLFPSMEDRFLVEKWTVHNLSDAIKEIAISNCNLQQSEKGYKGTYSFIVSSDAKEQVQLKSKTSYSFPVYFGATMNEEKESDFDYTKAELERKDFLATMQKNLVLDTPNEVINTLFYFSKIRASESIFNSSLGLIHSPGGGNYYVGIWANDQVEYSGPFFPYLGYEVGNTAAYNTYHHFQKKMPKDDAHIAYAFEVDGNFAMTHLDRGDAAMIAYGTSHFLLASGDKKMAKELWSLVEWSLDFCHKNRNEFGAVISESDEMEGRIPTGTANLSTSTLYYGGLKYSIRLAESLGFSEKAEAYRGRLFEMGKTIEEYFGATMEGEKTYKYFDENKYLRHWICLPLSVGIANRKEGTLNALFDKLWMENGILVELSEEGKAKKTFWDRATLYALQGAMKIGATERAYDKLQSYSENDSLATTSLM